MNVLTKWSVSDYHRMIEADILRDRHVELLAGEMVEMSPAPPQHYSTAKRGTKYLENLLAGRADVRFNGPITLVDSEPEPDIAIVRLSESDYGDRHPQPEDIFWVIEVAKTSLDRDLTIKSNLIKDKIYASAAIPEYWVLDLSTRQLIVFRQPQGDRYTEVLTLNAGTLTPLAFPDVAVSVSKLFL